MRIENSFTGVFQRFDQRTSEKPIEEISLFERIKEIFLKVVRCLFCCEDKSIEESLRKAQGIIDKSDQALKESDQILKKAQETSRKAQEALKAREVFDEREKRVAEHLANNQKQA